MSRFVLYIFRCSTYNPLVANTNNCVNCGEKFVHSFVSFELLPLVEFQLDDGISDEEAARLIETPLVEQKQDEWTENISENQQTLQLDNYSEDEQDPFACKVVKGENFNFQPVVLNRKHLLALDGACVLICKWNAPLKYQYFRNLLPDLHILMCEFCFKCYHVDDFELQLLQNGHCPFCRKSPNENGNANLDTSDEFIV